MVSVVCMMYVGLTCNVGHHGLWCMHDVRRTYVQCRASWSLLYAYVGLTCNVGHHGLCCMHDVRGTYVQCRAS